MFRIDYRPPPLMPSKVLLSKSALRAALWVYRQSEEVWIWNCQTRQLICLFYLRGSTCRFNSKCFEADFRGQGRRRTKPLLRSRLKQSRCTTPLLEQMSSLWAICLTCNMCSLSMRKSVEVWCCWHSFRWMRLTCKIYRVPTACTRCQY